MPKTNQNSKLNMANATIAGAKNFDPESVKLMLEQGFKEEYLNEVARSQEEGNVGKKDEIFNNASAIAALKIYDALGKLRVYSEKKAGKFFKEFIGFYDMNRSLFEEYDKKTLDQAQAEGVLASDDPKQDTLQSYVERLEEAHKIKHNLTETGEASKLSGAEKLIKFMTPPSQTPESKVVSDQGSVAGEDVIANALKIIQGIQGLITVEVEREMSKVREAQTSQPTNDSPDWHGKQTVGKDEKKSWVQRLGGEVTTTIKGGVGETSL